MRGLLFFFFIISGLFASSAAWALDVVFFEKVAADGKRVELTKGGRFFHVALRHKGKWLHTDLYDGVVLAEKMPSRYGHVAAILSLDKPKSMMDAEIEKFLGIGYDSDFRWDNDKLYCSELVAKLLGVEPRPMSFDGSFWDRVEGMPDGEPGISPDALHEELLEMGFYEHPKMRLIERIQKKCQQWLQITQASADLAIARSK